MASIYNRSSIIDQQGAISHDIACNIIRQAAEALEHARVHQLVHRDVKPSNLMLNREGVIKLLDLGLAALNFDAFVASQKDVAALTSVGQVMGTIDYISPEQLDDPTSVDTRTDVYGLAATLYALCSGQPPFGILTEGGIARKIMLISSQEPTPLRELNNSITTDVAAIVEQGLKRNPQERIQTPGELGQQLAEVAPTVDLRNFASTLIHKGETLGDTAEVTVDDTSRGINYPPPVVNDVKSKSNGDSTSGSRDGELSVADVIEQLEISRLVSRQNAIKLGKSAKNFKTGVELLASLVKQGVLTKHQARFVRQRSAFQLDFGSHYVLDLIESSSKSVVYRGMHRKLRRVDTIKVLVDTMSSENSKKRFFKEAQLLAKLRHPNILEVYHAGEYNDRYFLTMEYIQGRNLENWVKDFGVMDVDLALNCIKQAAEGLRHAHHQGILHRDVKPSNLLLDSQNAIRILNLGVTRIIAGSESNLTGDINNEDMTNDGSAYLTPDFMAPEQAFEQNRVDERADVYSLGCTLYFLLTGEKPFEGKSYFKTIMMHRNSPRPKLRVQNKEVSPVIERLFSKMVSVEMDSRYRTMGEFLKELDSITQASATHLKLDEPEPDSVTKKEEESNTPAEVPQLGEEEEREEIGYQIFSRESLGDHLKLATLLVFTAACIGGGIYYFNYKPAKEKQTFQPTIVKTAPVLSPGSIRFRFNELSLANTVEIDGQPYSLKKMESNVTLKPGQHVLKVTGKEIHPFEHRFNVASGDQTVVTVFLTRKDTENGGKGPNRAFNIGN
ncbi:serine/threonine protein kinase [Calycomorphotria hydatis]|uniref:Serine/threonine-protein kinase PknB n=1 Tax=Calycomorphotria hydatis TaxID=2528027 RepID=A0A517T985_9PLAN|nr:serine/threonine-protein kinase [Calycomorphotria hydatis]QDT64927.1 Serine/threonine-protein kinase PknB [Calycomorphotria hydatis]